MATNGYINSQEDATIQHTGRLHSIAESWHCELLANENHPLPANRDCWGTLYTNLLQQQRYLTLVLAYFEKEFKS